MAILCLLHTLFGPRLFQAVAEALPGEEVRVWPDVGDGREVSHALIWRPQPGLFDALPNLRLVCATGAGVDHFLADPTYPRHVPLVRQIDAGFARRMADYVLAWTLFHHRDGRHYQASQHSRQWQPRAMRDAGDITVGILGLGQMGGLAADVLAHHGFCVRGWVQRPQARPGVTVDVGPEGLTQLLAASDILVNLLPLTPATRGILCRDLFQRLKPGAVLINVGRGPHLVEADLIPALDHGHLSAAVLDVFQTEPLPEDHAFWGDPRITITPHVSSSASETTVARHFADAIRRERAGEPLFGLVDLTRGY
ncbi:MAG: glyoxylate/hydroxypyruvate reductase A [Alphaproteobacteria bacterium]|nr:MAG: glyoxylate/hydroxypyruvate reductase A [Alphaproteobacteria bacterium]